MSHFDLMNNGVVDGRRRGISMRNISRFSLSFDGLPIWRKLVVSCAVLSFFLIGSVITFKEIRIYRESPTTPVTQLQQVYPLHVMHGSLRYVSRKEEEDLLFWKQRMGSLVGLPLIVAFVVLATSRRTESLV